MLRIGRDESLKEGALGYRERDAHLFPSLHREVIHSAEYRHSKTVVRLNI